VGLIRLIHYRWNHDEIEPRDEVTIGPIIVIGLFSE